MKGPTEEAIIDAKMAKREWPGGTSATSVPIFSLHAWNNHTLRWFTKDSLRVVGSRLIGVLHREDGPALVRTHERGETKEWWVDGGLHREDGPAVECTDGTLEWWVDGKLHRVDGPAAVWASGTRSWWIRGRRYRENGPAAEHADGTRAWYVRGQLHREDGPAIEDADGSRSWWIRGHLHRDDGPAVEHANGTKEWWIRGKRSEDEEAWERERCLVALAGVGCVGVSASEVRQLGPWCTMAGQRAAHSFKSV